MANRHFTTARVLRDRRTAETRATTRARDQRDALARKLAEIDGLRIQTIGR